MQSKGQRRASVDAFPVRLPDVHDILAPALNCCSSGHLHVSVKRTPVAEEPVCARANAGRFRLSLRRSPVRGTEPQKQ